MEPSVAPWVFRFPCGVQRISASFLMRTMSSAAVACLPPPHLSSCLLCVFEVTLIVVSVKSQPVLESVFAPTFTIPQRSLFCLSGKHGLLT